MIDGGSLSKQCDISGPESCQQPHSTELRDRPARGRPDRADVLGPGQIEEAGWYRRLVSELMLGDLARYDGKLACRIALRFGVETVNAPLKRRRRMHHPRWRRSDLCTKRIRHRAGVLQAVAVSATFKPMKSLISEFSYGFALTHELVGALGSLSAAPVFPSLIEEGRAGGGYDVKLEAPGLPLFLQFKRSDCLSRRSAREIRLGAPLTTPYYRIEITAKADSDQHEMLIDLDRSPNLVFYAAPMFHQKAEFDTAFLSGTVRQQSFFVRPRTIGHFADTGAHHVSFDGGHCVVMSEPRVIEGLGVVELEALLRERLDQDKRPLRATVNEAVEEAEAARIRARQRLRRRYEQPDENEYLAATVAGDEPPRISAADDFRRRQADTLPPAQAPKVLDDPGEAALQRLADIGLREFNAQLYIVQAREAQ